MACCQPGNNSGMYLHPTRVHISVLRRGMPPSPGRGVLSSLTEEVLDDKFEGRRFECHSAEYCCLHVRSHLWISWCKVQAFPIEVNTLNQQTMTLPRKEILTSSSLGSSPSPKHPINDSPGVFQH